MTLYESVFIARQDISSSQVDSLADSFEKIIQDGGGQVPKREYWGLRSLAYKIKKNRKGHYVLFNIDAPSEAMLEYERIMKLNEDILRYMTLRVDELETEPSVVMQGRGRSERPERGERFEGRREDRDKPDDKGARGAEPAEKSEAAPVETKADEPAKAEKPEATAAPEAEAVVEDAPKSEATTDKPKAEKAAAAKAPDAEAKDSDEDAAKTTKADAAKDDKKAVPAKKTAAAKKKGDEK